MSSGVTSLAASLRLMKKIECPDATVRLRRRDHRIGFGGSVSTLRLTEKGYRVLVIEAGRRFEDEDLPKPLGGPTGSCEPRRWAATAFSASTCCPTRSFWPVLAWAEVRWSTRTRCTVPPAVLRTSSGATSPTGRLNCAVLRPGSAHARGGPEPDDDASGRRTEGRRTDGRGDDVPDDPVGVYFRRRPRITKEDPYFGGRICAHRVQGSVESA